jgi:hypothetical protein
VRHESDHRCIEEAIGFKEDFVPDKSGMHHPFIDFLKVIVKYD